MPLTIVVLPNDTDPDGDTLTVIGATVDPTQGTVTVNPDGTLTFTPAVTFTGPAVITYIVQDENGGTSSTTVTIARGNVAPTAEGREVYTYCGTSLLVNALRMATDVDGDAPTIVSVSQPRMGKVAIMPNGYARYTPGRMFRGNVTDSFIVTLSDGKGGITTTEITVRSFDTIAGTFQGLIEESAVVPPPIAPLVAAAPALPPYRGRITATMNGRASFTAALEVDGRVARFTGTLTGALQAEKKVRIGKSVATVKLKYADLTDSWQVTIEGLDKPLQTAGDMFRSVKSTRKTPAVFNVLVRAQAGSSFETAPGAAVLSMRANGATTIVGKLPSGAKFSMGSRLNGVGGLKVYRWLSAAAASEGSSIGGTWRIMGAANEIIGGGMNWRKDVTAGGGVEYLEAQGTLK